MKRKNLINQSRRWDKLAREIRGLLYDAHNQDGYEIPLLWAQLIQDTALLMGQVAKAYREGRPELPEDPVWYYTTHKDSPVWQDDYDIPF
jgi:hypothetical protein